MPYDFSKIIDRTGTNSYKYDLRDKLFGTEDIFPMWVADMDFATPDFVMNSLKDRMNHPILGYTLRSNEFNESIAEWLMYKHKWNIKEEWISFAPGVVPALNLLVLAFTHPGDKIIVQPPVYFPFFSAVKNHQRILVNNPLKLVNNRYEMDFNDLRAKIDKDVKMLFLCSPQNPGGMVWQKDTLTELAAICLENKILLVSDEIHADLVYKGFSHIPTASLGKEILMQSITCMAPSKTFNTAGLSTSYLIIPNKQLRDRYNSTLDHVHVGAGNIFGDEALIAAYKNGREWLNELMAYLKDNLDYATSFLQEQIPKIRPITPEATYMLWLNCTGLKLNASNLNKFLIQKAKLGLSNGSLFGQDGRGFQRMNFACPRSNLEQALAGLKSAVENLE